MITRPVHGRIIPHELEIPWYLGTGGFSCGFMSKWLVIEKQNGNFKKSIFKPLFLWFNYTESEVNKWKNI